MKILFVENAIVGKRPGLSGGETRFLEMARGFMKQGHEIHLLSSEGARHLLREFHILAKLHVISSSRATARWVFWVRLWQSLVQLPHSLRAEEFDIVYSCSEQIYNVVSSVRLVRRSPGARLVVVVHWLPPSPPWRRSGNKFFNNLFFWLAERSGLYLAVRFAHRLLPVSEATAAQLRQAKIPERRFRAVECGVDLAGIRRWLKRSPPVRYDAVFMKRIQRAKGIFDLIEAWLTVTKRFPKARLAIIGEGIDREPAEQLVKKLKLERNIDFLGVIYDFKEKFQLIASSKLFLLPTHEENWAIVIGEAMAAGTPIIAYGLKELKAVWGEACTWVRPLDVEGFAEAIVQDLAAPQARKARQRLALEYVKRYDWTEIARKELELITAVK